MLNTKQPLLVLASLVCLMTIGGCETEVEHKPDATVAAPVEVTEPDVEVLTAQHRCPRHPLESPGGEASLPSTGG